MGNGHGDLARVDLRKGTKKHHLLPALKALPTFQRCLSLHPQAVLSTSTGAVGEEFAASVIVMMASSQCLRCAGWTAT